MLLCLSPSLDEHVGSLVEVGWRKAVGVLLSFGWNASWRSIPPINLKDKSQFSSEICWNRPLRWSIDIALSPTFIMSFRLSFGALKAGVWLPLSCIHLGLTKCPATRRPMVHPGQMLWSYGIWHGRGVPTTREIFWKMIRWWFVCCWKVPKKKVNSWELCHLNDVDPNYIWDTPKHLLWEGLVVGMLAGKTPNFVWCRKKFQTHSYGWVCSIYLMVRLESGWLMRSL